MKQIEKSIAKKEHHIKKADGPGEDKPKSTRAPKFTKKYYYSNVVDNTILTFWLSHKHIASCKPQTLSKAPKIILSLFGLV
jgi:hypothetical protein